MVESHFRELSLGEAQLRGILAARGHKKVAALAAVVRTQQFMDRCGLQVDAGPKLGGSASASTECD